MKQVPMTSLLDVPQDRVAAQREWTAHGRHGRRGLLLEVAFYAGTVGPGLYMVSCLVRFDLGLLIGFLIVLLGYAVPHAVFLGRIERSWRAILKPKSSWISRGSIFAMAFLILAFLSVLHYVPALSSGPLRSGSAAFGAIVWAAFVSALLLAAYPGFLFSVLRAIPFWHSVALIPLFLAQAFGGGIALTLIAALLPGAVGPETAGLIAADLILLTVTAGLIVAHLYARRRSGPVGKASAERLLRGDYRPLFVFGALLAGLAAPLILLLIAAAGVGRDALPAAAALLQLAGIGLFKYCLLNVGTYRDLYDPRLIQTAA